jgi:hypothetical protein
MATQVHGPALAAALLIGTILVLILFAIIARRRNKH